MALNHQEIRGGPLVRGREPTVSIVIVNWNTKALLLQCLASLRLFATGGTFEVIVVDNASVDGSTAMMASEFPEFLCIANSDNLGFAAACNQGIEASSGRHVLLLNSDAYLIEDAIFPLVTELEAYHDIGMISGQLLNEDRSLQGTCGIFPSLSNSLRARMRNILSFGKARPLKYPFHSVEEHGLARDVDWIAGAFMLVRRDAIEKVGLLDASIFLFAEEWDWCLRFQRAGYRIRFSPTVRLVHMGSGSWTMDGALLNQARRAGIYHFCRKHYGSLRAGVFLLATGVGCSLRLASSCAKWLFSPRRRGVLRKDIGSAWRGMLWALIPRKRWKIRGWDLLVSSSAVTSPRSDPTEDSA